MRKIYIVRHGETDWNNSGKLQGQSDIPLNENGVKLALVTGRGLKDIHFDISFSSPLVRAYETGELILKENEAGSSKEIIKDDRLKEINFGEWEGLCCRKDNFEIGDDSFFDFFENPLEFKGAPGGETIGDVCARTGEFLKEIIDKDGYEGMTIAVFTHGCALRAMLSGVYDDGKTFWRGHTPPNCSVSIVEAEKGVAKVTTDDMILYDPSLARDFYM